MIHSFACACVVTGIRSKNMFGVFGDHILEQSMDQPGKVANPARGQLKRENEYFPASVRVCEFGLARRVRPSRPASACSSPTLRLNLVLTHHEIPPDFHGGVHLFMPPCVIGSVPSLSAHAIAYQWRSLPRVRWYSPVVLSQGSSSNGWVLPLQLSPWTN